MHTIVVCISTQWRLILANRYLGTIILGLFGTGSHVVSILIWSLGPGSDRGHPIAYRRVSDPVRLRLICLSF